MLLKNRTETKALTTTCVYGDMYEHIHTLVRAHPYISTRTSIHYRMYTYGCIDIMYAYGNIVHTPIDYRMYVHVGVDMMYVYRRIAHISICYMMYVLVETVTI